MKKIKNVFIVALAIFGFPLSYVLEGGGPDAEAFAGFLSLATWFALAYVVTLIYRKIRNAFRKKPLNNIGNVNEENTDNKI